MVYYRKYRPQTIDDLDNAQVRETLTSVLKNPTTHAFLFTGPKGLGKTSTARIIAKVVNCEKREDSIEPCNTCQQCISITDGTNIDVLEIDAASNRGIDEIRDLKEKIRLSPAAASKKVYIIDEVHMLTTEAFNALLKTLEEPPSHAMFILCTTEPHKVPATIISRCFHLNFKPATEEELVRSFTRIVKAENISIDTEALKYIAGLSDRGFRDGAKILEEVVALAADKKITVQLVEEKYQVSHTNSLINTLLKFLQEGKVKDSLKVVKQSVELGIDTKYFIQQLMEILHGLLLMKINEQKDSVEFTLEEIKFLFELFAKAHADTKFAVLPQLPLELAIIEYCESQNYTEPNPTSPSGLRGARQEVTVSSLRKQVGTIKKIQALYGDKEKKEEVLDTIKTTSVELMHGSPNGDVTAEWLDHFWKQLIAEMKQYNHTVAGLLRGCEIKSFDKKTLIIGTSYKFHKERLDDMKTRTELIKVSKLLTGKDVEVRVELVDRV